MKLNSKLLTKKCCLDSITMKWSYNLETSLLDPIPGALLKLSIIQYL